MADRTTGEILIDAARRQAQRGMDALFDGEYGAASHWFEMAAGKLHQLSWWETANKEAERSVRDEAANGNPTT